MHTVTLRRRSWEIVLTDAPLVVQLKLSAAAAGTAREKLPVYTAVPTSETNGNGTVNGRFNSFNEQSVTRASPRTNSLKAAPES